MTLPQRGIWKNSVLHNVLAEHQVRTKIQSVGKHDGTVPTAQAMPPDTVHANAHVPQALPGSKGRQQVKTRPLTYSPKLASPQTDRARNNQKFIPGTASATSSTITNSARRVTVLKR